MTSSLRKHKTIREVKRGLSRQLLRYAGVSGVGITGHADSAEQITVYLANGTHELRALVPATVEGYPVGIEVIGRIVARPAV